MNMILKVQTTYAICIICRVHLCDVVMAHIIQDYPESHNLSSYYIKHITVSHYINYIR